MFVPGRGRARLQQTLSVAYASGLLSDETFAARVDQLTAALIEPQRIVGDLHLRGRRRSWPARAGEALRRQAERVTKGVDRVQDSLLALDWTGADTEVVIGRHCDCDVVVSHPEVSRRHAQLRFRDGRWILQDLASRNGTLVNGRPVGRCELRPGDRVELGCARLIID